jgi:hypothetical protein
MPLLDQPISTPSAWSPDDIASRTDWQVQLTPDQTDELRQESESIADPKRPWTAIPREAFTLESWNDLLTDLRTQLEGGLGFALLRSLPVADVTPHVAHTMLWGLGQHLGCPDIQDAAGNLVHDVRDTGKDLNSDNIRAYQTKLPIHYHNDGSDAFMLLCYRPARTGGRSQLISASAVFNEILNRRPDLAAILQQPFDFDARGQGLPGAPPYQRVPIYSYHGGFLNVLYKRQYIDLAQRFDDVPDLTPLQIGALDLMDQICGELAFEFTMEPGDIVVANNYDILHARSAFEDGDSDEGRHMMRLWLSLPNGRPLPPVFEHTREFCHSYARRKAGATEDTGNTEGKSN